MCQENASASAESPGEHCSPADAMRRARAELEKAQAFYDHLRQQAAERVEAVRKTSVGDVLDGAVETVRRHPAAGLTAAALLGFFLGRLFRKR